MAVVLQSSVACRERPKPAMFRKILIANRGEIAVRVIRTCREMGIPTAAVFSDVDRVARHVRIADEAVRIGAAPAAESYLSIDRILDAARKTGADAVHPGYGFLSENADFAEACGRAGVKFIGPSPRAIRLMGSKTRAREAVAAAGVPLVPGGMKAVEDRDEALDVAAAIGFPIMLKAAAGGGGKGMRLVRSAEDWDSCFAQARGEAVAAFGNGDVYVEKAIVTPRHVEVQILADEHGQVIHLGERECSLQRRHQKVVEETPSPLLDSAPALRDELTAAAVSAARAANYSNAGTVEFLMDGDRNFYFLEMNTRLQVEHPVTEMVTGLDLVKEQILIAAGERLRYRQQDIRFVGSAMECRIYAEDPDTGFLPSPGLITAIERPSGSGVRVDSGADAGWCVPLEYDPLIAKLAVWAPTRPETIARLRAALAEYHIAGIRTTIGFFRKLVEDPDFCAGAIDTGFVERFLSHPPASDLSRAEGLEEAAILAAGLHFRSTTNVPESSRPMTSAWRAAAKQASLR